MFRLATIAIIALSTNALMLKDVDAAAEKAEKILTKDEIKAQGG